MAASNVSIYGEDVAFLICSHRWERSGTQAASGFSQEQQRSGPAGWMEAPGVAGASSQTSTKCGPWAQRGGREAVPSLMGTVVSHWFCLFKVWA